MFEVTTAVRKMLAMTARKKVVQGSTSSGKTYGIIPMIYDQCLSRTRIKATIVAETLPAVKEGALDLFMRFMQDEGRWNDKCWNAQTLTYRNDRGSKLQFKSFDKVGKAKASGKREILFLNEGNHIPYEIADALMIRSKEVWIDYNADRESWIHTEVLTEPNSEFLQLTYKDNESCPTETLEDLMIKRSKAFFNVELPIEELLLNNNVKSDYWCNWWKVYGLGMIGQLSGSVFGNWAEVATLDPLAKLLYTGVDFGFAKSKFASLNIYYFDGYFTLDELVYETGLTSPDAAIAMKKAGYINSIAYCDSAEPKSIEELKRNGIKARACDSKQDIKPFAIRKLNESKFYVTSRSKNLIDELRYYVFDEKTGKPMKSDKDHLMDALLYAVGSAGKYDGRY